MQCDYAQDIHFEYVTKGPAEWGLELGFFPGVTFSI